MNRIRLSFLERDHENGFWSDPVVAERNYFQKSVPININVDIISLLEKDGSGRKWVRDFRSYLEDVAIEPFPQILEIREVDFPGDIDYTIFPKNYLEDPRGKYAVCTAVINNLPKSAAFIYASMSQKFKRKEDNMSDSIIYQQIPETPDEYFHHSSLDNRRNAWNYEKGVIIGRVDEKYFEKKAWSFKTSFPIDHHIEIKFPVRRPFNINFFKDLDPRKIHPGFVIRGDFENAS
jgi:hypothetical protein